MKHYMVEITYTAPMATIDEVLPTHRTFLQTGYDSGMLLCSGPKTPRIGGIVIARAESVGEIEQFFARDPYAIGNYAEYRIVEFSPVKHQPFLQDWV